MTYSCSGIACLTCSTSEEVCYQTSGWPAIILLLSSSLLAEDVQLQALIKLYQHDLQCSRMVDQGPQGPKHATGHGQGQAHLTSARALLQVEYLTQSGGFVSVQ